MKKYYFDDGYVCQCENLTGAEIADQELVHGSLTEVMISGAGCVRCDKGILPVSELSNTKTTMNYREERRGNEYRNC